MSAFVGVIVGLFIGLLSLFGLGHNTTTPQLPPSMQEQTMTQATTRTSAQMIVRAKPDSGTAPLHVDLELDSATTQEQADAFLIDFGDGTTKGTFILQCKGGIDSPAGCAGATAIHTYTAPGTYTAKLISQGVVVSEAAITVTAAESSSYTGPNGLAQAPGSNAGVLISGIPNMTKYTDSDFGFSFWYPSSMKVSVLPPQVNSESMYGPGTKVLKTIHAPEFSLDEVYSPNTSILSSVDAGCCGSNYDKYYFDALSHTWMYVDDGGPTGGAGGTRVADVSKNTMGGLHIFDGYTRFGIKEIIPLSAHDFLAIYSKCNDATDYGCSDNNTNPPTQSNGRTTFNAAIQTIIATDPSVATPVSAVQQVATIQAEAMAYTGL